MEGRLAAAVVLLCAAVPVVAAPLRDGGSLKVIDSRLNKTGQPMVLSTVVREGSDALGDVLLTIAGDDSLSVDRDGLLVVIKSRLKADSVALIAAMDPVVSLAAFSALPGLSLTYERASLELVLVVTSTTGKDLDVSLRPKIARAEPTAPAAFSGYLNTTTLLNHTWDSSLQPGQTGLSFQFDGATRFMGLVLEGEAAWDGPLDSFICPIEAQCSYQHQSGFKRRGTRLVSDLPDYNTRLAFGDVSYWGESLQHGGDLLGVSVRHEARTFNVNQRLDSATASMLALDTPADVEVLVNGVPIQRLRLKAGTYRLTDLPLSAGSNDVELIVTADSGERRVIRVKALNHDTLLAPGKTEWTLAGGVPSVERDHQREYLAGDFMANARLRVGVTHQLTAHVHAQGDNHTMMGGGGVLVLTSLGLWGLSLAASFANEGSDLTGQAATLSWEYLVGSGEALGRQTWRAQADYRSPFFMAPGDTLIAQTGVLYPTFIPKLRLSSSWTVDWPAFSTTLSARYAFANPDTVIPGAVDSNVDRWGFTASFTKPLSLSVTGTLWTGFGNERLLSFDQVREPTPEFQIGVRLAWRPFGGAQVQVEGDSLLRQTLATANARYGSESSLWTTSLTSTEAESRGSALAGTVSYHGRFADTVVSHTANGRNVGEVDTQYSSVRSTTSVAFADGVVGVGPAIRDAFVLARPHPSIADSTVVVGELDDPKASGGRYIPAMLPLVPSYMVTRLPLDATDLPVGYSLGTGALSIDPPYRAGYAVVIGSDSPLSAYGVLVDGYRKPVPLTSGIVTPRDRSSPKLAVFTNSAGRFAVEGLSEGSWTIALDTASGHLLYQLEVVKGRDALINAGTLLPSVTVEKLDDPDARPRRPDVVADGFVGRGG